ncbi:MAG: LuxR C-terminal-related transcriptional regulator [Streptosporangiaceae bacterium]
MVQKARSGDGQRRAQRLAAVPALPHARVGVDVPIETKFHPPHPRPEWVNRPGLISALADTDAKLVLLGAPAGFGKTTLVAQWRASAAESRPFAWVSLDRGDDDPGRLWWHVVCALERACPQIAVEGILRALRVADPKITGEVLPVLINEIAALPAPVVLVLDDYYVITERDCHEQVAFLLRHMPPSLQIVLSTRAEPPLPLARLRTAGELAEIRAAELRFSAGQADMLLQSVAGVRLSEADTGDLVARTEGWPAALYLAALSLRGHPSSQSFIRQFNGDNRFIVDFLAEEVLGRQPREVQQFLARTAILGRFCAPLAAAVTESASAADLIDVLERENLFIVPLDDTRQWYRYHHLFAEVLRGQLAQTEPDLVPELHRRASAWYAEHGSADEAVSHAIAAGGFGQATGLVADHWFSYVSTGQVATVLGWIRSLGDGQIAASPVAAHCAAWAAALSGDRQTARGWLPVIDSAQGTGPLPDGMRSLQFSAALLRGVYGFEGLKAMHESATEATELEQDPASPWYALARGALGFSRYMCGMPEEAAGPLREAAYNPVSLPLTRIVALSTLSLIAAEDGRLPEAQELAQAARDMGQRDEFRGTPSATLVLVADGAVHAAQGRLGKARAELERALESRQRITGTSPWPTLKATLLLAQVLIDAGDRDGATELAGEAREVLAAFPDGAEALQARLDALERRLAAPQQDGLLAEPLTERELAVLHLLGGTLSLREIGEEMQVSANTVKTHTQAIYRKLGVSARSDAVEAARLLGL